MDTNVALIADYASAVSYADLPPAVVHDCKRRVIDTLGCGLGAFDAEPSRIARKLALRADIPHGARVLGTHHRTLPELATFANGVMVRYLDGKDFYPDESGGGHPSDVIAAILAAGEVAKVDGKTIVTAITLAYEVFHNFLRSVSMRENGLDHVFYAGVGSAVGAAKVLGLNRQQIANAISLAITPNFPLGATRRGSLSMWKGSAGGNAARNGVFAALLAAEGMTGPEKPVEGAHGMRELLGEFELAPFATNGPFHITDASLKYYLAVGHSQSPITAALQLRSKFAPEDLQTVTIHTYRASWSEIGSEREKWHPTTRETADHSLPYIIAAILIDGRFSDEIFAPDRLRDPRIHRLTDKISVLDDAELSRQFPSLIPCRIELTTNDGQRKISAVEYPRGHAKNPMTDEEVNDKFRTLTERVLPKGTLDHALGLLWKLDEADDLDAILASTQIEVQQR